MSISFSHRDEFVRKPFAEKLINLLVSDLEVSPMLISGDMGSGKSEFTLKLINYLTETEPDFQAIYIDIFHANQTNNALITLLTEILKILPESDRKPLIKDALPALRFALKTGFKGRLREEECRVFENDSSFSGIEKLAECESNVVLDAVVESLLTEKQEAEQGIKQLIQDLFNKLSPKQIIVFIDDIDRCAPSFSVDMIESLPMFDQVDNLQFVLVSNHEQLASSLQKYYGSDLDANHNLDRLFKFTFSLSLDFGNGYDFRTASRELFTKLLEESQILQDSCLHDEEVLGFVFYLIRVNSLSLRDVETLMRYFEIAHTLSQEFTCRKSLGEMLLKVMAVFIFCFEKTLSKELLNHQLDAHKLMELLGKEFIFTFNSHNHTHIRTPKHSDRLLALLCYEATENQDLYAFEDSQLKQQWQSEMTPLFDGPVLDDQHPKLEIINNTLKKLMLLNVEE